MGTDKPARRLTTKDILTFAGTVIALLTALVGWYDSRNEAKLAETKAVVEQARADGAYALLIKELNRMREHMNETEMRIAHLEGRLQALDEGIQGLTRNSRVLQQLQKRIEIEPTPPPEPKRATFDKLDIERPPVNADQLQQIIRKD